ALETLRIGLSHDGIADSPAREPSLHDADFRRPRLPHLDRRLTRDAGWERADRGRDVTRHRPSGNIELACRCHHYPRTPPPPRRGRHPAKRQLSFGRVAVCSTWISPASGNFEKSFTFSSGVTSSCDTSRPRSGPPGRSCNRWRPWRSS